MTDLRRLCRELAHRGQVGSAVSVAAASFRNGRWIELLCSAGVTSSIGASRAVDEHTLFDLASLTKPVTALAAARLVRQRRLAWSEPVGRRVDEARTSAVADAPLELLLAHRAGLAAHRQLFRWLARGELATRRRMLADAAAGRRHDAQGGYPSEGFAPEYSDLGYLLAGEMVARAAGAPLDDAMQSLVLGPLNADVASARHWRMRNASASTLSAATERVPWRGGTVRGVVHDENAWAFSGAGVSGHAGLFGTVRGALALGEALLDVLAGRRPEFLTRDEVWPLVRRRPGSTLRAGFDGKAESGSSCGSAFGPETLGHLGFTGTSLWCDPEAELVGVLLTNRVHPSRDALEIRRVRPLVYDAIAAWARNDA